MRTLASAIILAAVVAPPVVSNRVHSAAPVSTEFQVTTATNYAFPSGAGMLFFYVKPDRTADFESVVGRLATTLDQADDPVRKQQAANWRILKSVESTKDAAIYVFIFDPAVSGADYDPVKVLSEKQPVDIQPLYEKLRDATIRVERMGLTKLR